MVQFIAAQVIICVLAFADPAAAISWILTQETHFTSNALDLQSPDINNAREIIYTAIPSGNANHQVFSLQRGQLTFATEWFFADIAKINDDGRVILRGQTVDQGPTGNSSVYRLNGIRIDFGPNFVAPNGIDLNNQGEIIAHGLGTRPELNGLYSSTRGFLFGPSQGHHGLGINNAGQIVCCEPTYAAYPFAALGLTLDQIAGFDINNQGYVVFNAENNRIYVWDGERFDLAFSSANLSQTRINDQGEIVFVGLDEHGIRQLYVLEPTPEPATLLLLGTTAAGLGLARWKQRRRKQETVAQTAL